MQIADFITDSNSNVCSIFRRLRDVRKSNTVPKVLPWIRRSMSGRRKKGIYAIRLEMYDSIQVIFLLRILATWEHTFKHTGYTHTHIHTHIHRHTYRKRQEWWLLVKSAKQVFLIERVSCLSCKTIFHFLDLSLIGCGQWLHQYSSWNW